MQIINIKKYTSKTNNDDDFRLIKIKRDLQKKEVKTFYLKSKHYQYIKIAFVARIQAGCLAINKLKSIMGVELKEEIKGLTSDKIKIYQVSITAPQGSNLPDTMFKSDNKTFKFNIDENG